MRYGKLVQFSASPCTSDYFLYKVLTFVEKLCMCQLEFSTHFSISCFEDSLFFSGLIFVPSISSDM